jgi:phosphomannomutase
MKIYLFDIDGTLTNPRQKMSSDHTLALLSWITNKNVYLVTGSDYPKVKEQLPDSIVRKCNGIFCSMGNQFIQNNKIIYEKKWKPTQSLEDDLNFLYKSSEFPHKGKTIIEPRVGMINFSIVGREASQKERDIYSRWDTVMKERKAIVKILSNKYTNLDFKIGGQISIDIQPKGKNKSQASKWLRKKFKGCELYFFGDKCSESGNDYDIVKDIQEHGDGKTFCVSGPNETMSILMRD